MRSRLRARLVLAAGLVLVADQVLQHALLADGRLAGTWVAPHDPPLFIPAQSEHLAGLRGEEGSRRAPESTMLDADLGWCPRGNGRLPTARYDGHGARRSAIPLAAKRAPDVRRIVAIGCSFTHGDEVDGEECWAGRLSDERTDLEIANLGVGGYGLDQALLRLRRDGLPLAPDEVWLGWVPSTSLRVTTHLPLLYNHDLPLLVFKPRFAWHEMQLRLRPNPAPDEEALLALYADQARLVEALGADDLWLARARSSYLPRGSVWWHHSGLGRLVATAWERRGRAPAPWFRDADEGPARLVQELIAACAQESRAAGAHLRLLLLPAREDLRAHARGQPYWAATIAALEARGVEVIDLVPDLLAAGVLEDDGAWMPAGHYAPATQGRVAEALWKHLEQR